MTLLSDSPHFLFRKDIKVENVAEGVNRQVMGYNNQLMMVRVTFDENAVGYVHDHFHSQAAYVESGEFEVEIDGVKKTLTAGDSFFVPPNLSHGAVCKKEGILIDVFSPVREDFLSDDS